MSSFWLGVVVGMAIGVGLSAILRAARDRLINQAQCQVLASMREQHTHCPVPNGKAAHHVPRTAQ